MKRLLFALCLFLPALSLAGTANPFTWVYFTNHVEFEPGTTMLEGRLSYQDAVDAVNSAYGGGNTIHDVWYEYQLVGAGVWVAEDLDTDGDGHPDWEEWVADTDSNDPDSHPEDPPPPPVDPPTDTDGDGLPDALETMLGTDPNESTPMKRWDHSAHLVTNDTPVSQKYEVRLETIDGFITLDSFEIGPGGSYTLSDYGFLPDGAVLNLVKLAASAEFDDMYFQLPPNLDIPEVHDPFQGAPGSGTGSYHGFGAHNGTWGGGPNSPGGVGSANGPGRGGDNTVGGTPGSGGRDGVLLDFYDKDTQPDHPDPNPPFIGTPGRQGDHTGNGPGRTNTNGSTIGGNYNTGGGIGGNPGNGGNGGNTGNGNGNNGGGNNGNGVSDAWAIIAFNRDFNNWGKGDGSSNTADLGGLGEGAASTLLEHFK